MINDIERSKLEIEASIGDKYERIMDDVLTEFFVKAELEMFGVFLNIPTSKPEDLMALKMKANALESLKGEFKHFINTGKMARHTLDNDEENTDGK